MTRSEFLTEAKAMKMINDASVEDQDDFIQVDMSDTLIENIALDAPFFDFLMSKNRVFPTDSAEGAFRSVEVPAAARSQFATTEDGEDITNTSVDFDSIKYTSTVVARRIKVTDLLQSGSPDFDPMQYLREQALQDNYTAVDEGLFKVNQTNKFDGLFETSDNVTDLEGDFITLKDVQSAIQRILNHGGRPDGIIATGGAVDQLVASDDNENKKVYVNQADVILGKYSTQIMTPVGLVPLIVDPNANNRFRGDPAYKSDSVTIVDSSALEIAVQEEGISKPLGATGFADSELVGTFLRMGNLNPKKNAVIKGIGSSLDSQEIIFIVRDSVSDALLSNVEVEVTQTINSKSVVKTGLTNLKGEARIVINSQEDYSIEVTKTGYTDYDDDIDAGSSSIQEILLVKTVTP